MGASAHDTVIAGNGALGMSLGVVLARRGMSVAVVGQAGRPAGASAAAGAMNGCFGEVTPHLLRSEHGRLKLSMDYRATGLWDSWEQELLQDSDEAGIRTADGTTVILNTIGVHEIDTAGYQAIRTALEEYGEPYEELDPVDVEWLDPVPTSRPLRALHIPGEHAVDAAALLRALTAAFLRAGGTLLDDSVTEVVLDGGRVTGVRLDSGDNLPAGAVVVAAGAASSGLLGCLPDELRLRIPHVVAGRGVSLLVRPYDEVTPRGVIRTPNRAFACGLHIVPRPDGRVYLGATNEVEPRPGTHAAIGELNLLLGGTRQLRADLTDGWVERIMVGNRPVPLDGFPLLGEAGADGLWLMTGTYRDGLHQSPLLAQYLAARLLGEPYDRELDVFTPVRAPIQGMTRQQCLDIAVGHTIGTGYEHDWKIMDDWPSMMTEHFRRTFGERLDGIDAEYVPPPELLCFAGQETHAALRAYYAAHREAVARGEVDTPAAQGVPV